MLMGSQVYVQEAEQLTNSYKYFHQQHHLSLIILSVMPWARHVDTGRQTFSLENKRKAFKVYTFNL